MSSNETTFVTSFFYIYKENESKNYKNKTPEWRVKRFIELVRTNIKICIYVCPIFHEKILPIVNEYKNVKIMKVIALEDLWINRVCAHVNCDLPSAKDAIKDNCGYLSVINSKTEFMTDAIESNPFESTHFAWIDFNITYVFHEFEYVLKYLRFLSMRPFKTPMMVVPGCWKKWEGANPGVNYDYQILDQIHWRFCGGFFIGDKQSILDFAEYYRIHFVNFVNKYKKLVWEVNFWAWLNATTDWEPTWFLADHNDTMITGFPSVLYCDNVRNLGASMMRYEYPIVEGYVPSSAAYVNNDDDHILNVRYVNYMLDVNGNYRFIDNKGIIRNKNVRMHLGVNPFTRMLQPYDGGGHFMEIESHFTEYSHVSRGLEDIRLYEHDGRLRFIGTTMGYYHSGGTRLMLGDYDIEKSVFKNAEIVESPYGNYCEKNWVPICDPCGLGRELFIYRWAPFEVGEIHDVDGNRKLEIVMSYENTMNVPLFRGLKGSGCFLPFEGDKWIGVTHYSEEYHPRQYFHVLIVLDKMLKPVKYSNPFVFNKVGIEFCIGLNYMDGKLCFWISQMDRNPVFMMVDLEKIPLNNYI